MVVIEDLDLGGMSVTNNIENIIEEISLMESIKITPDSHIIIYKDSDSIWTGWHMKNGFIPVDPDIDDWHLGVKYILKEIFI